MSAAHPLGDPGRPAATDARQRLQEEIERIRTDLEGMLGEHGERGQAELPEEREGDERTGVGAELEGDGRTGVGEELRHYVGRRVDKSERRLGDSIRKLEERSGELERRLEGFERERMYSEWRIHANTEAMLDSLLRELRSISSLLGQ